MLCTAVCLIWKEEMVVAKTLQELSFVDLITAFNTLGASILASLCKIHNGFSISWIRLN